MNAQDPGGGGTKEKWAGRPNRRPAVKNNVHQATLLGRNSLDLPNSTQKLTYSTDEDAVMDFFSSLFYKTGPSEQNAHI